MIGVIAHQDKHSIVREFFELFKTPWEFYRKGWRYDVLIYVGQDVGRYDLDDQTARLVFIFADHKIPFDEAELSIFSGQDEKAVISYHHISMPIYGHTARFNPTQDSFLTDQATQQSVGYIDLTGTVPLVRLGYDLFKEVAFLLSDGQPPEHAFTPTLDLHIALLRDLMHTFKIYFVEVPPIPYGYNFVACLTHDIDHPAIRYHKWDHTMFGFLYRAVVGSAIDVCRRRIPLRHLLVNWKAAISLPLVHLGLAGDFWHQFDRYLEIENGMPSTFFVIPFRNRSGHTMDGVSPRARASGYAAQDIADHLVMLAKEGCEIGLHGIDAWCDCTRGYEEREEVIRTSRTDTVGVRMHWLYFDAQTPVALERAGFAYDSSMGYNETVGYRSGTTQVFRPLRATQLLELPLHIMDTALFFPCFMNLSALAAEERVHHIIQAACRLGGAVTINWHDRSLAPERLWGEFYVDLIEELKSRRPWFATAAQAVAWFRKRRSVRFHRVQQHSTVIRADISDYADCELPGLLLRRHAWPNSHSSQAYSDASLTSSTLVSPLA